jgi:BirA family biotin operon repressor/biotin-[acetyl-CoA-carboxylase] ligase
LEIHLFNTLPSTQSYLEEAIAKGKYCAPVAVLTKEQTQGIGSRENSWSGGEGNFFASIAVETIQLPSDLPLASASIYFAFMMKQTLSALGQEVWLKWPNDIYQKEAKVGGCITKKVGGSVIFGLGVNLKKSANGYSALDSDLSPELLLEKYLLRLDKFPTWKQIFSEYKLEFGFSREFLVHIENYQKSLVDAVLCEDGSLMIEGRKVFSLR